MSLSLYNKKRDFKQTAEPKGVADKSQQFRFVVQRHYASRLHYDFRLELGGVLKSWAVPKGPSLNPKDKRLAVMVEDHPVSYINFYGSIPEGNYGAGEVEIWDEGKFIPINENSEAITEKQALASIKKGELKVLVKGKNIEGEFVLVQLKNAGEEGKNWLLIKHKDEYAVTKNYDAGKVESIKTPPEKNKKVWKSSKPASGKKVPVKKTTTLKTKSQEKSTKPVATREAKVFTEQLKPMLAGTAKEPFNHEDWLYEMKWDGYRALALINDEGIKLYSRNGIDFSKKFAPVYKALNSIRHSCLLDGEIVLLNKDGHPDFSSLQHYDAAKTSGKLVYYVFDLLMLNDQQVTELKLLQRKELLKKLLGRDTAVIRYSKHSEGDATAMFEEAAQKDLEGIMAKEKDSTYSPGLRSKTWLKIKNIKTGHFSIAGYIAGADAAQPFRSLVLASKEGNKYHYVGHVGTGFNAKNARELKSSMDELIADDSPFAEKVKVNGKVIWLKPKLNALITYTALTGGGLLRHAAFMGVVGSKAVGNKAVGNKAVGNKATGSKSISNKENGELKETGTKSRKAVKQNLKNVQDVTDDNGIPLKEIRKVIGRNTVIVSNPNKVYFPEDGITKKMLIDYYEQVAPFILPHLKDRPLSLKRNPDGIHGEAFYHKDAGGNAPKFVKTFVVRNEEKNKDIDYIVCNNTETLLWVANLGCIEMNPWNSTIKHPGHPDYLVIDLDPGPKNNFNDVIDAALVCKELADKGNITASVKTSGASGLHIYMPLQHKYAYEVVKQFAELLASLIVEALPNTTTTERTISKRNGKMYIDFLQNRSGQTLASAYSVRPVIGAQVSAPLEWKEVKHGLQPSQFTIHNMLQRCKKQGDLFEAVLGKGNDLKRALKLIG